MWGYGSVVEEFLFIPWHVYDQAISDVEELLPVKAVDNTHLNRPVVLLKMRQLRMFNVYLEETMVWSDSIQQASWVVLYSTCSTF